MANQFLIKNKMADMRDLSASEIASLQGGIYAGVELLGYYEKGDTPAPIIYYYKDLNSNPDPGPDDGGSVVKSVGVTLVHVFAECINVRYFGAKGDGLTDDTDAIKKVVNRSNVQVKIPKGRWCFANVDTGRNVNIVCEGKDVTTLIKNQDGYLLDLGELSTISDASIYGGSDLLSCTGDAILITRGRNTSTRSEQGHQRITNCRFENTEGYFVRYEGVQKGWMSIISKCDFGYTTQADAAVKWPREVISGGNRTIDKCYSAIPLVNVGGCDNGIVTNNNVGSQNPNLQEQGIIFPLINSGVEQDEMSKKLIITGNRFAIANGTMSIRGLSHLILDNIFAGIVSFGKECNDVRYDDDTNITSNVTWENQSVIVNNKLSNIRRAYMPTWNGTGSIPSYGNAVSQCSYRINNKRVRIEIFITFGTTTTFGATSWSFSVPIFGTNNKKFSGTAFCSKGFSGIAILNSNSGLITVYSTNTAEPSTWGATTPATWVSGDYITISLEYDLT